MTLALAEVEKNIKTVTAKTPDHQITFTSN